MENTKTNDRFIDIVKLQNLLKQKKEIEKETSCFNMSHCRECGDTTPKHGFYPLWGMAIGEGIHQTSGLICNRCARTDNEYEEIFKEPKEFIDDSLVILQP